MSRGLYEPFLYHPAISAFSFVISVLAGLSLRCFLLGVFASTTATCYLLLTATSSLKRYTIIATVASTHSLLFVCFSFSL